MTKVVGVRFKDTGKTYYFDPKGLEIKKGDLVVVETARGMECGVAQYAPKEVAENEVTAPLKPVLRIATARDKQILEENKEKEKRAYEVCLQKIEKHKLDMNLTEVEYAFDGSKILFYFTADGRVDFRELVKDLASTFHTRIELRQIGVRDEAKMLGGIGSCGRALCCHSWLADFEPVSIKMAKVQNLSLNPSKISGICGRLMCCLKYENDIYMEFRKGMPDIGERVKTPDGVAKVIDTNLLERSVKVRLYVDEKPKGKRGEEEDQEEKLSADIYTYKKEEIRRIDRRKSSKNEDIFEGVDADTMKEIKELIKD
jgi:cell fate regulator YaaT (PSP1 superfamily)